MSKSESIKNNPDPVEYNYDELNYNDWEDNGVYDFGPENDEEPMDVAIEASIHSPVFVTVRIIRMCWLFKNMIHWLLLWYIVW